MIKIKNTLQQDSASNDPKDVLNIKNALSKKGYYETPDYGITPYPDKQLFSAIKSFQKDNDLKIDGVIHPEGETLNALNDIPDDLPHRSPVIRCPKCGAPHGGSQGNLCPDCATKN